MGDIPKAVEKQAKAAEERIKAEAEKRNTEKKDFTPVSPDDGNSPGPAPEAQGNTGGEKAPEPAETGQAESAPKKDHKQLYEVLQGKYNAEVPRLSRQIADITRENAELKAQVAEAQLRQPAAAQGVQEDAVAEIANLDPDSYADYGPEIVNLVATMKGMANTLSNLSQSQAKRQEQDQQSQQQAKQDESARNYFSKIRGVLQQSHQADFDAVNKDPMFLSWLNGYMSVPEGGMRMRNEVLQEAHAAGDANSVVTVFQAYLSEGKQSKPPARESVSPTRGAASKMPEDVQATGNKAPYTRAQVKQFFRDVSLGKFKGQEEWVAKTQADIIAATNEGRIT